jgi:hypothetical protein
MEEQQNIKTETETPEHIAAKAWAAQKQRNRTARLRALGLNARGKPLKDRHKNRDPEKQRVYQANYGKKHKAARERLGLTIAAFNKLPRATRLMELNYPAKGAPGKDKTERNRARSREWYRKNKGKAKVSELAGAIRRDIDSREAARGSNGPIPAPTTRDVRFCPHCGWNIDATRKAQAFIDGRVG